MLGFFFGFNARLGRLHYFLASLVLIVSFIVLMVGLAVAISAAVPQQLGPAVRWLIMVMIGLALWSNTMLQAMRFRDIGWDPVCVLPAWLAIMVLDHVVATRFPEYALTTSQAGTLVGGLINLGLCVALTFFPSGASDSDTSSHRPRRSNEASPAYGRGGPSVSESRLARITSGQESRRGW